MLGGPHIVTPQIEVETINFLIDGLQLEFPWFEGHPRGFDWWAGPLAQRVRLDRHRLLDGVPATTLHVETDLLRGVPMGATTWERLASMNTLSTLSAYVADQGAGTIRLHASVTLTADNWPMARMLAIHACALQVADAHAEAAELARIFGGHQALTAHPTAGSRRKHDELVNVDAVYRERGQGPSPFTPEQIAQLVHLEPRPWLRASSDRHQLSADLEFAKGQPSRLELDASAQHPDLGSGLQMRLVLPIECDPALAQRLNASEAAAPDAHQLGAWGIDDAQQFVFSAFIPSAVYMPELARTLIYHLAGRNEWVREQLFPQ